MRELADEAEEDPQSPPPEASPRRLEIPVPVLITGAGDRMSHQTEKECR